MCFWVVRPAFARAPEMCCPPPPPPCASPLTVYRTSLPSATYFNPLPWLPEGRLQAQPRQGTKCRLFEGVPAVDVCASCTRPLSPVIFDIEIFDRQEVGEYLGLEDAIYDAEAALQTFLQSIMDLGTRLIMIYTRGGVHLTACVLSFWSCAYMARKPLEHLRAMLAKQDYVGRHDLDDEDMEEENVSYSDDEYDDDAIKVATLGPDVSGGLDQAFRGCTTSWRAYPGHCAR